MTNYLAQNRSILGDPGDFAFCSYDRPTVRSGTRVPDYTPPGRVEMPTDPWTLKEEARTGLDHTYGIPLTHAAQQIYAREYGKTFLGFGNGPITFTVNWRYFEPTDFTVEKRGGKDSTYVSWVHDLVTPKEVVSD